MLRLTQVVKEYGEPIRFNALSGVSLAVPHGQFCALVGPSGSGKSTLLNLVGLLDTPTSGSIFLNGQEVVRASATEAARLRNELIGFVFQTFQLLSRLTALENVALPLLYRQLPAEERRERAQRALDRVDLASKASSRPAQLSGGQRQRVAIARALVGEPRLLLADEPTGSLDSVTAASVMGLLRSLNEELGLTILMVTHDAHLAGQCARQIEMLDGRIVRDSGAGA